MELNLSKSVMDLMFWGRLFHNFGAIFSKAISPSVLDFTRISERFFDSMNEDCDQAGIAVIITIPLAYYKDFLRSKV